MENCRRRQSSSVSVLLPTGDHNPSVSEGDGDSAAGIDSWQRVVRPRYLVSPSRFETPRSVPVIGDRAVAIFFHCSRAREAVVCERRDKPACSDTFASMAVVLRSQVPWTLRTRRHKNQVTSGVLETNPASKFVDHSDLSGPFGFNKSMQRNSSLE